MLKKFLACVALIAGSATANAGPLLLDEGFDDLTTLSDWYGANLADPDPNALTWFEGNAGIFEAAAGAPASYLASNYVTAGPASFVDTWLITPVMTVWSGFADLTFSTRTDLALGGNVLQVLVNNTGVLSLDDWLVLDTIDADVNTDWTDYTYRYSGGVADVRFAFRYLVDDVSLYGDYVGIDTVQVRQVPEPGTLAMLAMAMLLMPAVLRRRRARS